MGEADKPVTAFMTKAFARFARKARLTDSALTTAAEEVANGEFDADLGGHVYKQRVARSGEGRSGGFRTIILFKAGGHIFFVEGFAKNEKANISVGELQVLRGLAKALVRLSDAEIGRTVEAGELVKVIGHGDQTQEG